MVSLSPRFLACPFDDPANVADRRREITGEEAAAAREATEHERDDAQWMTLHYITAGRTMSIAIKPSSVYYNSTKSASLASRNGRDRKDGPSKRVMGFEEKTKK